MFLWDCTGSVACFFDGDHKDFTVEMVEVAMCDTASAQRVISDSLWSLGRDLVDAMQYGRQFLLNLGLLKPDFRRVYTCPEAFPADMIFDNKRLSH